MVRASARFELAGFDCTTVVVEVEGVIDVQGVLHRKSVQMVTHLDINPVQQSLTLVLAALGVGFGQSNYERCLHLSE